MKPIYLLGAAGSIGSQTLDVIQNDPEAFQLVGISVSRDQSTNISILDRFQVEICCLRTEEDIHFYQERYPSVRFVVGDNGLLDIAAYPKPGILVNALSGSAGLRPTMKAIESGKDIALANKETLVMAGEIVMEAVKTYGVRLLPVDSEHSALWQVLKGESILDVNKLIITASGGALRHLSRHELRNVTIEDALKHPNWQMGAKITIDSATMMNKGLEVIEAHHLFGVPYSKIETLLHDESVVHGIVSFKDGTMKASLSASDMRIPIAYALYHPLRPSKDQPLQLTQLSFKPMDFNRFPLLKLAYEVGLKGGILPTVMNASNEAAVKLFLRGDITFLDIETIITNTVLSYPNASHPSLEDIIETDRMIQQGITKAYEKEVNHVHR
jgi:1-deoxy-D-xylulose-5-phosphate reductoisomerase